MQPLSTSSLSQKTIEQNEWQIEAPDGLVIADLLDCSIWAFIANRLGVRDQVTVWASDNSWMAVVAVLDVGKNWAKVDLINKKVFEETSTVSAPDGYDIKWAGPHAKWRVLLNGRSISEGHSDKESASKWAEEHKKSVTPPKAA